MDRLLTYYISGAFPTVDVSKFDRTLCRLTQIPAADIWSAADPDSDTIPGSG
jgi:hypothetical protein